MARWSRPGFFKAIQGKDGGNDDRFSSLVHTVCALLAAGSADRCTDTSRMADRAAVQDSIQHCGMDAVTGVRDTVFPVQDDGEVLTGRPRAIRNRPAVCIFQLYVLF